MDGGSRRQTGRMDLDGPCLARLGGSHISSQDLAVTQADHHTYLNLCFRLKAFPQAPNSDFHSHRGASVEVESHKYIFLQCLLAFTH